MIDDLRGSAIASGARQQRLGDLLRRSAGRHPAKLALAYRDRRHTFAALDAIVNRTAHALIDAGIRHRDHVALFSHNSDGFVILRFALARIGAVTVPINFMLKADEVAFILAHVEASAIFAEDALADIAEQAVLLSGRTMICRGELAEGNRAVRRGWDDVRAWMQHPDDSEPVIDLDDDAPVQILYTSGTESRPKGVVLTARNLYANYTNCIVGGDMAAADVEVHALPLYHCAQLDCFLTPDLLLGATSILLASPDAANILKTVAAERATKLFCPPTVWLALLQHPDFDRTDLSSLRKGYYGASIMPVEIIVALNRRLPAMALYNLYGQTELAPLATLLRPEDQVRKLGSAGRPALHVETRVVDDEDRPLPPGEVGEIVHRGASVMLEYWNDAAATAAAFRGGWFHSGDLGVFDDEGYLSVVDRKKDMIKTGGENVASREIEEIVFQHPDVAQAAVFGIPHPRWIEAVAVAVVAKRGATLADTALIEFLAERLAAYKVPKYVVFLDDLPKNATGKVLKRQLRDDFSSLEERIA